jgi:hypothetical protein
MLFAEPLDWLSGWIETWYLSFQLLFSHHRHRHHYATEIVERCGLKEKWVSFRRSYPGYQRIVAIYIKYVHFYKEFMKLNPGKTKFYDSKNY